MYSILLVEDEKGIRENIQRGIVWEKLGFYIAASASNGEQAMEKLEKFQPDVLLTDIRMPFMDGLELSRMVKRIMPTTRIVILSGYMEFAYAKEAISIGVEEYLVKPVTPMKLLKTFTALKEKMDAQRQQEVSYTSFAGGLWEVEDQLTENTVKNIDVNDLKRMNERVNTLWTFLQQGSMAEVESFTDQYLARCEPGMLAKRCIIGFCLDCAAHREHPPVHANIFTFKPCHKAFQSCPQRVFHEPSPPFVPFVLVPLYFPNPCTDLPIGLIGLGETVKQEIVRHALVDSVFDINTRILEALGVLHAGIQQDVALRADHPASGKPYHALRQQRGNVRIERILGLGNIRPVVGEQMLVVQIIADTVQPIGFAHNLRARIHNRIGQNLPFGHTQAAITAHLPAFGSPG